MAALLHGKARQRRMQIVRRADMHHIRLFLLQHHFKIRIRPAAKALRRSPGTLGLHIAHRREHGVRVPGDRYGMHGEYLSAACDHRFQFPYFHHFVPFWHQAASRQAIALRQPDGWAGRTEAHPAVSVVFLPPQKFRPPALSRSARTRCTPLPCPAPPSGSGPARRARSSSRPHDGPRSRFPPSA